MSASLISVIIPCYNAEAFVGETIRSVLDQTYANVEVIVLDDGSTDGSREVVAGIEDDRVRLVEQSNQGACRARNRGAREAGGAYLTFLDADDRITPETLTALNDALDGRTRAVAWCPWKRLRRVDGQWVVRDHNLDATPPDDDPVRGWLSGWFVPPCGIMWTRDAFEHTGEWDEELAADQDGELMLRAFLSGVDFVRAEGGTALYRDHGTERVSVSTSLQTDALRSRARVLRLTADRLRDAGRLDDYRVPLGRSFYGLARRAANVDAELSQRLLERARDLAGHDAVTGNFFHRLASAVLGLPRKERLARLLGRWGLGSEQREETESLLQRQGSPSPDA
jgi:glycosyltransferase involved in cell wall biosynthesis